ncbi:MAG: hypothetical protein LN561_06510 [Rickettsia endosymbiont of Labidopullus appendiculatus]|nr:hypothetical protein [Rickettsia endosymbiont of Labidopullus appendiculatus]
MSTKLHLAMTTLWHIIEGFLTTGNRNDIAVAEELTADIVDVMLSKIVDVIEKNTNLEELWLLPWIGLSTYGLPR